MATWRYNIWVNQVWQAAKDESRQIRIRWSLKTSFDGGIKLENIASLVSNKTQASVYMIVLFENSWNFRVWK